jgi:hypothetical protein
VPRRPSLLLGAYLALQLLIPLRYYLGFSSPRDERFAWRMFSILRLEKCGAGMTEEVRDGGTVRARNASLESLLPQRWLEEVRSGWDPVIERVLERQCRADPSVVRVTLAHVCEEAEGTKRPETRVVRDCAEVRGR